MIMRFAYNLLTYLLSPVYAFYWFLRGFADRAYLDRFGQRFGFGYPQLDEGTIWIHAVSVGEVQASAPLVRALISQFPGRQLLITTVTPTGAARVTRLFGDGVAHCFIPFETPHAIRNFFRATKPQLALIMETEIWPNLYQACGKRKIPLILVSARLSPKSVDRYRWLLPLFRETLSYGIIIAAQSQADADRFKRLGASEERTWVTGNIKFDIELEPGLEDSGLELRARVFGRRPVWIAASTHDREEEQVLAAHRRIRETFPDAMLVLVPRHPERFPIVAGLLEKQGFEFVSRTENVICQPQTEVFLGDTMGEVPLFYAASDVAFVGGTLIPVGGHNLLEPAALGRPVISGPNLFNTQEIADMFAARGASTIVHNAEELAAAVTGYFANEASATVAGKKGLKIIHRNKGALNRLLVLMEPLIGPVNTA